MQTFYFSDGPYLQALQGMYGALSHAEAFVKFVGQPRTGKSSVCEKLAQYMRRKDYRVIYFDYPIESPDMLRSVLAQELDVADTYNIFRHLEDKLSAQGEKPLVIIFDDAHRLSDITLIEISQFVDVQVNQKRAVNLVLCGEPELERRLSSKRQFNSLQQQISHNFLLEPMCLATSTRFLSAYLKKRGCPGIQLDAAALNQVYRSSKGFPAPVYSLCELIFSLGADGKAQRIVTRDELLSAIRDSDDELPIPSVRLREGNRWMLIGPLAVVAVIASLALLLRQLSPPDPASPAGDSRILGDAMGEVGASETEASSPFAIDEFLAEDVGAKAVVNREELPRASVGDAIDASSVSDLLIDPSEAMMNQGIETRMQAAHEEPVSDSSLALVTAQERGISSEVIAEPLFEELSTPAIVAEENSVGQELATEASSASDNSAYLENPVANRPSLSIDDDQIGGSMDVLPAALDGKVRLSLTAETISAVVEDSASPGPQQAVQNWLDAWEGQDLETYFASYAEEFVPRYHRSKSAWFGNRERVIGNASEISLNMSDFSLIREDLEIVEVHFWLAYRSPSYRDDTHKKLILKKIPSGDPQAVRLVILEEINLEVRV